MTSPTAPESVCATCKGERRIYSTTLGDLSTRLCPDCVGTGRRSAPESVDVAYPTYCSYCCEPGKERVDSDDHDRVVAALAARLSSEREELRRSEDERRRMEARLASVEKALHLTGLEVAKLDALRSTLAESAESIEAGANILEQRAVYETQKWRDVWEAHARKLRALAAMAGEK
jgi:NMD protein affecting ribosome stability and mRNA decay